MTTTTLDKNGPLDTKKEKVESLSYVALQVARGMVEDERAQVAIIKQLAQFYPPLWMVVRYAPGLRWGGNVTKRWNRFFSKIYPRYVDVAIPFYRKMGAKDYEPKYPQLTHPERVWKFMNDVFAEIVEATNAKLYELLMELKVPNELDTKSKERMEFMKVLTKPDEKKGGRVDPAYVEAFKKLVDED